MTQPNFPTSKKHLTRSNEYKVKSRSFLTNHLAGNNFAQISETFDVHKNLGHFTFALRFFIDRWSFVVTRWSFEVGNDFSLAQQSFTTLVLILLYPCLPVPWSKVSLAPRSNKTMCPWPSRAPWPYVTKSVKKVLDKKSGRLIYLGMLG